MKGFPAAAREALRDAQLRRNLAVATGTIRRKRAEVVRERSDWEELREAGRALKERVLCRLDEYLLRFEAAVERAGGTVHWARDADEANRLVVRLVEATGAREVVKVKSLTTDEIRLNDALAAAGIAAVETDLAELICQLAGEEPSHILVPAIHKNRVEIRDLFRRELDRPDLSEEPAELADAARRYLRRKFLGARVGVSGANFAVAETGTVADAGRGPRRPSRVHQRPPWTFPGAQLVEQADRMFAAVAREVAVVAVDHGQAGAHVAVEVEGRDAGTEREGRESVSKIVDPAQRLDPGRELRRLPLPVAEVVQVEVAAPLGGEHECALPTRWLLLERLERDRLQRHRPPARLSLRALQPTLRERAMDINDARP